MSNTTTTNAKKKALLITTVSGFVPQFEMNNVRILQEMGYEVHYATNYNMPSYGNDNHRLDGTGIIRHQIDFVRSPFDPSNIKIFRQLCQVMRDESFSLVHCHTPMGGVMARLASHHTHTGPVIYTAHGFHFFKGAHLVNWLFYYPMERFLSRFTLQQLCINQEDYHRAKRCFHACYVDYIPGAGIDLNRIPEYSEEKNLQKRRELGIPDNAIFLLSSGELIKRKNHETVLRALAKLRQDGTLTSSVRYVICGHGKLDTYLKELANKLSITDIVLFAGYRKDILDLCQACDLYVFPSYQEGLPMGLLEAMACSCPVLCSDIRGNQDLMGTPSRSEGNLEFCSGGIMIRKADDVDSFAKGLLTLIATPQKLKEMGTRNASRCTNFSQPHVESIMRKIYSRAENRTRASAT